MSVRIVFLVNTYGTDVRLPEGIVGRTNAERTSVGLGFFFSFPDSHVSVLCGLKAHLAIDFPVKTVGVY